MWTEAFERLHDVHLAGAPREEIERLAAEELDELLLREEGLT
jgi:hypothetical protein